MAEIPELLQSQLAGRYRMERELGRGGMATVYLAEDERHRRSVAIKVLSPEIAAHVGIERFRREIAVAARLQHPHILTLLDSGAVDGFLYYVMPHVEGESLRERLRRERQLPIEEATRLAAEVALALDYAHQQGVVHRDIKPENILLSGGQAMVADFGIARAIGEAGGAALTSTGVVIGTPSYMSPEQALGGRTLDGRSDLYSLGCVLYEMIAGQPPFTGPDELSVSHQHVNIEPRPITDLRPAVAPGLTSTIQRALAKAPADRFATGAQLAEALARPASVEVDHGAHIPSHRMLRAIAALAVIAVLAFAWIARDQLGSLVGKGGKAPVAPKEPIIVSDFDGVADDPGIAPAVRELVASAIDQSGFLATVSRE